MFYAKVTIEDKYYVAGRVHSTQVLYYLKVGGCLLCSSYLSLGYLPPSPEAALGYATVYAYGCDADGSSVFTPANAYALNFVAFFATDSIASIRGTQYGSFNGLRTLYSDSLFRGP